MLDKNFELKFYSDNLLTPEIDVQLMHPQALQACCTISLLKIATRFPALPTPEVASVGASHGTVRGAPTCRRCSTSVWSRVGTQLAPAVASWPVWAGRRKGSH